MTNQYTSSTSSTQEVSNSWLPMMVIALGQFLLSFNVASLPMSIGPMVETFNTPPTTVGTAIVMYSLFVAAFIMLGAKIGQIFGARLIFQVTALVFGGAMVLMVVSPTAGIMIAAQGIGGATAAAMVPTFVMLIASNYKGRQQAKALGMLGSAQAFAGLSGFLVAGMLGTWVGWRYTFALLIPVAVLMFLFSFKLQAVPGRPELRIDKLGVVLAALAVILLSLGFNNLNQWGLVMASSTAPFEVLGISPAPIMILLGALFGQAFFAWSQKRERAGKPALLALEVLASTPERAAVVAMFTVVALGATINFLVPLYIQIVQGRTSLQTGIAMLPYNLTIFFAALLVVRFYDRLTPKKIARNAFAIVAIGMLWLAFVIRNDWSTFPVMMGLITVGIGQGALVTLLFNVLVTSSSKEYAGDVGSLRGTVNNLAGAVGTAIAGALAVALLSALILQNLADNPNIPASLMQQVNLDSINFLSNDRLQAVLSATDASPQQVAEAVRINTEARLRALKIAFMLFSGIAMLAVFPARRLPDYIPGEVPASPAKQS